MKIQEHKQQLTQQINELRNTLMSLEEEERLIQVIGEYEQIVQLARQEVEKYFPTSHHKAIFMEVLGLFDSELDRYDNPVSLIEYHEDAGTQKYFHDISIMLQDLTQKVSNIGWLEKYLKIASVRQIRIQNSERIMAEFIGYWTFYSHYKNLRESELSDG